MPGILLRILIAAICCGLAFALIPAVFRQIGADLNDDLLLIIRVCIAVLAVFYILKGTKVKT